MKKRKVALDIFRRRGLLHLSRKSYEYISNQLLQGGVSSRPQIESVSGVFRPGFNLAFDLRYGSGVDIFNEDWDNLLLLDACRFDDYEIVCDIDGDIDSRISQGTDSERFIMNNIEGKELRDVVCVTANPHYELLDDRTFHSLITSPIQEWDNDLNCVPPSSVTEAAIDATNRFPNKRLLIHYMQPHDPPLGPTADEMRARLELGGPTPLGDTVDGPRLMEAVANNQISIEKARRAYRETLNIVLQEVERLLKHLVGKTVISSDHGEMFGEQPYPFLGSLYEHYRHPRTVQLCRVPWHTVEEYETRKKIVPEPPAADTDVPEKVIDEQLESLGYK